MSSWAMYSIFASAMYALSAIPLRYVSGRQYMSIQPEIILLFTCFGAFVTAALNIYFNAASLTGYKYMPAPHIATLALVSGVISSMASLFVIKAMSVPESSVSNIMAIIGTNSFFALILSMLILGEYPDRDSIVRVMVGTILIISGGRLACQ